MNKQIADAQIKMDRKHIKVYSHASHLENANANNIVILLETTR